MSGLCDGFQSQHGRTGTDPVMKLGLEQANLQCRFPGISIPVPINAPTQEMFQISRGKNVCVKGA